MNETRKQNKKEKKTNKKRRNSNEIRVEWKY